MFDWLNQGLGYIIKFCYSLTNNYALALLLFAFLIKLLLFPLGIKQQKNMVKQAKLRPREMAIRKKYAGRNDQATQQKMQQEVMNLYQEENFNPMGGCLPMLIQMPIIMGLFALLRNPMRYIPDDNMIFAFHESFLWIEDLSQPDPWILPIIAGVGTFLSFSMNQSSMTGNPAAQQTAGMMKMMKYVFPIMILWMAKAFPSGLALYWAVSQIIQIFFNLHLNSVRKKIKQESEAKAKKKKSKNSFLFFCFVLYMSLICDILKVGK